MDIFEKFAPGFITLTPDELNVSRDFALLWTLFEAQVLDANASASKIKEKSKEWFDGGLLEERFWVEHLNYFKGRYVTNDSTNHRFEALNLRRGDDPELVKNVMLGVNQDATDNFAVCLIIILRFRNNFFHGLKWAYGMQDQRQNFEMAINLICICMERFAQPN
ncbi:hypothetical protein ACEUC8_03265 [Aeromonas veronii]|uniref:hypothetical protein n=1 Tax=Aeromonas veronii TaxID=654 RepID=UPI0031594CFC